LICNAFVVKPLLPSARFSNVPNPSLDCIKRKPVHTLSSPRRTSVPIFYESLSSSSEIQKPTDTSLLYEEGFRIARETHRIVSVLIALAVITIWANVFLIEGTGLLTSDVQMSLLAVGFLWIGIPHGMMDIDLTPRVVPGDVEPAFQDWVVPYLGAMCLTLVLWSVLPQIMFVLFILNTIIHFGEGDLSVDTAHWNNEENGNVSVLNWIEIFARGSYFTVTAFHQNDSLSENVQGVLGGGQWSSTVASDILPFMFDLAILHYVALLVSIVYHLGMAVKTKDERSWTDNTPHIGSVVEMIILSILFWIAPAHISVFTYFLIFHSPRHVLRIYRFSEPESLMFFNQYIDDDRKAEEKNKSLSGRFPLYIQISFVVMCAFVLLDIGGLGWAENLEQYITPVVSSSMIASTNPEAYLALRMIVVGTSMLTTPHAVVIWFLRLKEGMKGTKILN